MARSLHTACTENELNEKREHLVKDRTDRHTRPYVFTPPSRRAPRLCAFSRAWNARSLGLARRSSIAGVDGVAENSRPIVASARTDKPVYPSIRETTSPRGAIPFLSVEFAFERKLGIPAAPRNRFPGCRGTRTNPLRWRSRRRCGWQSSFLCLFLSPLSSDRIGFSRDQ